MSPVRVGVIGCGTIGKWHARILAEDPSCALVGVSDTRLEVMHEIARTHDTRAYATLEELLTHGRLQGLVIATPDAAHYAQAVRAIEAGCHLLIEKPVAQSTNEIRAIAELARCHAVHVMGAHVERFETGAATMKEALMRGACGRVVSLAARHQFQRRDAARFAGVSSTLRTLAVHDFDLLSWLHEVPITQIHTIGANGTLYESSGLNDHLLTLLSFADGAIGLVESGWTLPDLGDHRLSGVLPVSGNNRLEITGDAGILSSEAGLRNQQLVAYDDKGIIPTSLAYQTLVGGRVVGALREETNAFVRMIRDGTASPIDLASVECSIALLEAAECSLATAAPVAVGTSAR